MEETRLLDPNWMIATETSALQLAYEFSRPIFLPRKRDGAFSRYRFPNRRARDIVASARFMYSQHTGVRSVLRNLSNGIQAREYLSEKVQGLGMKEASHFLRDTKFSSSLAIIDTHVIKFLQDLSVLPRSRFRMEPKLYIQLEKILEDIARSLGTNLAILDIAIWNSMREGV